MVSKSHLRALQNRAMLYSREREIEHLLVEMKPLNDNLFSAKAKRDEYETEVGAVRSQVCALAR